MNHSTIKAIQTKYAGHLFRSRLEARWAVFFDASGMRWAYENEGYEVEGHGRYLPDFFLPETQGGVFVEVKPENYSPDDKEADLWRAFSESIGRPLLVVRGVPKNEAHLGTAIINGFTVWSNFVFAKIHGPVVLSWSPWVDAAFRGAPHRGFEAARCARFEHGETPKPRRHTRVFP